MNELLKSLTEIAKENLKRDGHLVPVIMWLKENKFLVDPQIMAEFKECNAEDAKTKNVFAAGALARLLQADQIILSGTQPSEHWPLNKFMMKLNPLYLILSPCVQNVLL